MKVWDEDDCEEGSGDNAVYGGDVGELPSDLDNDVCKITLATLGSLSNNRCVVRLYEDANYEGALLGMYTLKLTATTPEAFSLPESQADAVSSIRLSGACDRMKMWDQDGCEEGSSDNAVFTGDVGELPSDLDDDVCKITVYHDATCAHPDWFQCKNGRCIASTDANNGNNDCSDWSDEFCTEEHGREALCASINTTACSEAQATLPEVFGALTGYEAGAAVSMACPETCGTCSTGASATPLLASLAANTPRPPHARLTRLPRASSHHCGCATPS
jgi:hypothetical protein